MREIVNARVHGNRNSRHSHYSAKNIFSVSVDLRTRSLSLSQEKDDSIKSMTNGTAFRLLLEK
jgi:hypothetical protein